MTENSLATVLAAEAANHLGLRKDFVKLVDEHYIPALADFGTRGLFLHYLQGRSMRRDCFRFLPSLIVMELDESDMDEGEEHPLLSALQIVETLNLMNWVSQLASENSKKLNMITISPSFLLQPFPLDLGRLLSKSAHRSEGIYEARIKNLLRSDRTTLFIFIFVLFRVPTIPQRHRTFSCKISFQT